MGEHSARGIPASFDMTGPLPAHWSGSALIGVEDNHSSAPVIFLIDKDGRRDQFSFSLPDAETVYVHGLAMSSSGRVAIAGGAVSGDSRAGSFLALVAPDRESQRVVRTWPYVAWEVEVLFSTIENASIAAEHAAAPLKSSRKTWVLDRETRRWVQLQIQDDTLPGWSTVLDFDGQTLAVTGNFHEIRRYKRMSADSFR
jgi:hypothetical protein